MILIWRTYWFVTSLCSLVGALFARVCRAKERSKMVEGFPELQVAKIIEKGNYKIIIYSARSFADGTRVCTIDDVIRKGSEPCPSYFFFSSFFNHQSAFFFATALIFFVFYNRIVQNIDFWVHVVSSLFVRILFCCWHFVVV